MQSGNLAVSDVAFALAVAAAVKTLSGVAALSPGRPVEVATYGPHEKVQGVLVRTVDGAVEADVHVVAQYASSLDFNELAARIRSATVQALEFTGAARVGHVDVTFDDVRLE
jgi:hypothetical protein